MPLIILIIVLALLKYFEVWKFAAMSWWWVGGLMLLTFIWFEFIEKILGLDKKKAHKMDEEIRKKRVKEAFEKDKNRR